MVGSFRLLMSEFPVKLGVLLMSERPPSPSMPDWKNSDSALSPLGPPELPASQRKTALVAVEDHHLAWAEFKREYPRMSRLPGFAAFILFTALGQSLLSLGALVFGVFPWFIWLIMFLLTTVLWEGFVIQFAGLANRRLLAETGNNSRAQIEGLQGQVKELEERLTAKNLVVSYDKGRYDHKQMDGKKLLFRTVRLKLENKSDRDINDIRVKAESFTTAARVVQQVPLRIQHDINNQKKEGFSLSPGEIEMVDVVERQIDSPIVLLCPAIPDDFVTQEDQFRITVAITAKEQPKQRKLLHISKHDTHLLHCVPLKG